jgi:hypothetical protein
MGQPTPYTIQTDFSADESANLANRSTVKTVDLDIELENLKTTLDEVLTNLTLLQRDDGKIDDGNGQPHLFNLSSETSGFLNYKSGNWSFLADPTLPAQTALAAAEIAQAAAEAADALANQYEDDAENAKLAAETAQAAAEVAQQSIPTVENTQSGSLWYALSTGTATAYQLTLNPVPTSLNAGLFIHMKAHATNTGPATLDVNSQGIKTLKTSEGNDLEAGDININSIYRLIYDGTDFILPIAGSKIQLGIELNASNTFRAFEEIQENHGGALLMEAGWSDSFSNANEQGADEANSTDFQHDPTNKLYKGTDAGTALNSDKDYTTEANYLQQEWDKTKNGFGGITSQATVASGTVVTITADTAPNGKFPSNCVNGRISFDAGSTWFDISARNSDTQLTLDSAATNGTFDYIIQMTGFDSGVVQLNSVEGSPSGDGRDGSVTITTSKNINTDVLGSLRSTYADGIVTAVTANPTGTSVTVSSINGFADGDKLMLINLQGGSGDIADVGNYELLTVSGSPSGSTINIRETISKSYDGSSFAAQKVVCQRIPQWSSVDINTGGTLTCSTWNGTSGGIVTFYASATVTVSSGTSIDVDEKGYRGGDKSQTNGVNAKQGESRTGLGAASKSANDGGGGGAFANNGDGGGGSNYTVGTAGHPANSDQGSAGGTYGDANITQLIFGSGGGGGGYTVTASNGANGGGIVYISAETLTINGNITSKGGISAAAGGRWTEGGGGAGGLVYLKTNALTLGTDTIQTIGGGSYTEGLSGTYSQGGDGPARLEYTTINTNAHPSTTDENTGCDPDPTSTALTNPLTSVTNEYISICDTESKKTNTSAWTDINSGSITETLNSQNIYYWLAFDAASSFGDGTEIKIFNPTDSVWRAIAKNNAGTWEYNNDSGNSATYTGVASTVDNMLHAISQAISTQAGNRMTGTNLAAITDTQWEETDGWSTSISLIIRGVTLYSNSSAQNPSVSQYRLNYDSDRAPMNLQSKTYDPGFVPDEAYLWSRAEHSDADGSGTFSISRNGGTEWTAVSMLQQGLPLTGDVRILRGTIDISGQTSGQDLRCRYQTTPSKDQFLHSWGLQAKP